MGHDFIRYFGLTVGSLSILEDAGRPDQLRFRIETLATTFPLPFPSSCS